MDRQKLKELDIRQLNTLVLVLMRDDAVNDVNVAVRRWSMSKRDAQSLATMGIVELEKLAAGLVDPVVRFAGTPALTLLMSEIKVGAIDETILISQMAHLASMPIKS